MSNITYLIAESIMDSATSVEFRQRVLSSLKELQEHADDLGLSVEEEEAEFIQQACLAILIKAQRGEMNESDWYQNFEKPLKNY